MKKLLLLVAASVAVLGAQPKKIVVMGMSEALVEQLQEGRPDNVRIVHIPDPQSNADVVAIVADSPEESSRRQALLKEVADADAIIGSPSREGLRRRKEAAMGADHERRHQALLASRSRQQRHRDDQRQAVVVARDRGPRFRHAAGVDSQAEPFHPEPGERNMGAYELRTAGARRQDGRGGRYGGHRFERGSAREGVWDDGDRSRSGGVSASARVRPHGLPGPAGSGDSRGRRRLHLRTAHQGQREDVRAFTVRADEAGQLLHRAFQGQDL